MRKLKFSVGAKFTFSSGLCGEPSIAQVLEIAAKAVDPLTLAGGQAVALWECFLGLRPDRSTPTGFAAIEFIGTEESAHEFAEAFGASLTAPSDGSASQIRLRLGDEEFVAHIHNSMNGADLFGLNGPTSIAIDGVNVRVMNPLALLGQSVFSSAESTAPSRDDLARLRRLITLVERFIADVSRADLERALNLTEWLLEALELPDTRKTLLRVRAPILEAAPLSVIETAASNDLSLQMRDRLARLRVLYSEARQTFTQGSSSHAE